MGYCINQVDSSFTIKRVHHAAVLRALKQLALRSESFSWVENAEVENAETLKEALLAWRWEASFDGAGDLVGIQFAGEKAGDDAVLFSKLAPFVQSPSYIEMQGEDGARWRWVFEHGDVKEVEPRVLWE